MTLGYPVVNAGEKYINGLGLSWSSNSEIVVSSGQCRDSENINDISLDSDITIDSDVNGAGGLDDGDLANNTLYAVYVIGDSLNNNDASALISADLDDSPSLPRGYDMVRRVGYVLTDGTPNLLEFRQYGHGSDRWMYYDAQISALANGASAAWADIDMSDSVPGGSKLVLVRAAMTPNAAGNSVYLRPNGATADEGWDKLSAPAANEMVSNMLAPVDDDAVMEYKVDNAGDSVDIDIRAYLDQL